MFIPISYRRESGDRNTRASKRFFAVVRDRKFFFSFFYSCVAIWLLDGREPFAEAFERLIGDSGQL